MAKTKKKLFRSLFQITSVDEGWTTATQVEVLLDIIGELTTNGSLNSKKAKWLLERKKAESILDSNMTLGSDSEEETRSWLER